MRVFDCIQGSDEWFAARLGHVTASNFSEALAKGAGATRRSYMLKLLAERMTGIPQDTYSNATMRRGIEVEPEAKAYYEAFCNVSVEQVGFVEFNELIGASPDGLVGAEGTIEIKCPNSPTHICNILQGKMPTAYIPQVQGVLWVAERKWCDFISFDPRVESRPFWSIRIERDEEYIKKMSIAVRLFVEEMKEMEAIIRNGTCPY